MLVLLVGLVLSAQADDPAQEKARVEAQMAQVRGDLAESSAAMVAAVQALDAVDAQLLTARDALATSHAQLDVAKAEDERLARDLASAQAEEHSAERRLLSIQADIHNNEALIGEAARAAYQGTSLDHVAAAFDATSMDDLARRIQSVRTVMHSQSSILFDLGNDRASLATTQANLEGTRERVATAKDSAAANVADKTRLEAVASAAEAQVAALRDQRAQVLAAAQATNAEDEAQYLVLGAERTRLEEELRRRAEAAAAAAARAADDAAEHADAPPPSEHEHTAPTPPASGPLYRPVLGPITSPYGMRVHPITGIYKLHDGTDFGSGCGTPIRAAASGTVLRTTYSTGYGNQTVIEHGLISGSYLVTSYSHQANFAVSPGEYVDRGEVIGYVGRTGYSTGCHLHFMVYQTGQPRTR